MSAKNLTNKQKKFIPTSEPSKKCKETSLAKNRYNNPAVGPIIADSHIAIQLGYVPVFLNTWKSKDALPI